MSKNFLIEKETRYGVKLVASPLENGALKLAFQHPDGTESSLKVTNRDAHAFRKLNQLHGHDLRYTGGLFKLYASVH